MNESLKEEGSLCERLTYPFGEFLDVCLWELLALGQNSNPLINLNKIVTHGSELWRKKKRKEEKNNNKKRKRKRKKKSKIIRK